MHTQNNIGFLKQSNCANIKRIPQLHSKYLSRRYFFSFFLKHAGLSFFVSSSCPR